MVDFLAKTKAVLFDFDGVIAKSHSAHLKAWKTSYQEMTGTNISLQELKKFEGLSIKSIRKHLSQLNLSKNLIDQITIKKEKILIENIQEIEPYPSILILCNELNNTNIPWGIVSNSSCKFIETWTIKQSLNPGCIIGLECYQEPKPSPEPWLKGAKMLNIRLSHHRDILGVEDSITGIRSLKKAGMRACGFTSSNTKNDLVSAGADICIDNFDQLRQT